MLIKSIKKILKKNIILYRFTRYIYNNIIYYLYIILFFFNYKKPKSLIFFKGSYIELLIIRKSLVEILHSIYKFDISSLQILATYLYLNGYFFTARKIYKHIFNLRNPSLNFQNLRNRHSIKNIITPEFFSAFGHMAYIDTFIKQDYLIKKPINYNILTGSKNEYSNSNFYNCLSESINNLSCNSTKSNSNYYSLIQELSYIYSGNNEIEWFDEWSWRVQEAWFNSNNYKTVTNPSDSYIINAKKVLHSLGISDDNWFVVIHLRENNGSSLMNLRDVSSKTYTQSIMSIIEQGGYVFRIGTSNLHNSLNIASKYYIDLTQDLNLQSIIDIYILSKCRFFLGTGSGPSSIASQVFHRPLLSTNIAPLASRIPFNNQLLLPKSYININTGINMRYKDRINFKYGNLESESALKRLGFIAVNNSPEQLLDATNEMISLTTLNDNGQMIQQTKSYQEVVTIHNNYSKRKIAPCAISNSYIKEQPYFLAN